MKGEIEMEIKITIDDAGNKAVWINSPLDINLTSDEVATMMKDAWKREIIPIQRLYIDIAIAAAHSDIPNLLSFDGKATECGG